jgi:C-terminal processing protease CtpA/Prc
MLRSNRAGFLLAFILILTFAPATVAQKRTRTNKAVPRREIIQVLGTPASAPELPPEIQRRVDTFEKVWVTLNENYFDPTFNNLDWIKIYQEFSPKARAAKTDAELHHLLGDMINRLQRSHLAIIPPDVFQAIEKAKADAKKNEAALRRTGSGKEEVPDDPDDERDVDSYAQYGVGIELRLIDDKFVISRVDKTSSAAQAGLKTGHIIQAVNDVSLPLLLAKVQSSSAGLQNIRRYLPHQVVQYFLNGDKDATVKINFIDEKDQAKELIIPRTQIKSRRFRSARISQTASSFLKPRR